QCTGLQSLTLHACMTLRGDQSARLAALPALEEFDVGAIDEVDWRSAPGDFLGPTAKAIVSLAHEVGKARGIGVTDEALAGLARAPRLRVLNIEQPRCSLAGLDHLRESATLTELNLCGVGPFRPGLGGSDAIDLCADCL